MLAISRSLKHTLLKWEACSTSMGAGNGITTSSLFRRGCRDRKSDGCLMGIEPLPNIRDGILVERLVKTVRYIADMRRCQYVVERPEGVRRRQRLNVEYVDRRAGDSLVLQHADQSFLFDDRPT